VLPACVSDDELHDLPEESVLHSPEKTEPSTGASNDHRPKSDLVSFQLIRNLTEANCVLWLKCWLGSVSCECPLSFELVRQLSEIVTDLVGLV